MPLSPPHDTTSRWKCQGGNDVQRSAVSNLRQLTDTAIRCRGLSCILDRGERFDGGRRVEGSVEEHAMKCGSGRIKLRFPRVLRVGAGGHLRRWRKDGKSRRLSAGADGQHATCEGRLSAGLCRDEENRPAHLRHNHEAGAPMAQ